MEIAAVDTVCEEREEGEIVEDDLEDVSDCSMSLGSPFFIGKSVSPPELLSAVCLSSVSSSEYSAGGRRCCVRDLPFPYGKNEGRRRPHKRRRQLEDHASKRKRCHQPRHHRKPEDSDTDSANEVVDPKYAKKLRVALRRESTQDLLHNSLRTRLKAFIEPSSHSEDELSLNALRDLALLSTLKSTENLDKPTSEVESEGLHIRDKLQSEEGQKECVVDNDNLLEFEDLQDVDLDESKKEENLEPDDMQILDKADSQSADSDHQTFDSELRELRIAALKSFVLENHQRRRRKAAIENCNNSNKGHANDVDKENDKSIINNDLEGKPNKKLPCESEKISENALEVTTVNNDLPSKTEDANADDGVCTDCGDSLEEDADILRAMLLASMSTRLAGKTVETDASPKALGFPRTLSELRKVEKSKNNHNSLSVTITKPFFRTIKNDLYSVTNTNHPKNHKISEQPLLPTNVVVKPLIINVNADSDSDTENLVNVKETNKTLKATVTEFLKKQRAEAEASAKKKPNGSPQSSLSNISNDPLMEKSVMKLLPQSQQLEYRRLKQQLINARKKKRLRKPSQRVSESKRENSKKVPKVKTDDSASNSGTVNGKAIKAVQEMKNVEPAGNLHRALNELQIRKNGRLQMKGKYRSLAPLLHRINQASTERRQHEIDIKKLLLQIQKARTKLAASHQIFTTLVQQLLCEKNTIDQRVLKMVKLSQSTPFTSTPNKLVKKSQTCDISSVKENCSVMENDSKTFSDGTKINNAEVVASKVPATIPESEELKSAYQINQKFSSVKEKCSVMENNSKSFSDDTKINNAEVVASKVPVTIPESEELKSPHQINQKLENEDAVLVELDDKETEVSIDTSDNKKEVFVDSIQKEEVFLDPNDITKIFVEQPIIESIPFPKYTSPLHNRDGINDPLITVCPYDLLGVCKDKECRYMHCS